MIAETTPATIHSSSSAIGERRVSRCPRDRHGTGPARAPAQISAYFSADCRCNRPPRADHSRIRRWLFAGGKTIFVSPLLSDRATQMRTRQASWRDSRGW